MRGEHMKEVPIWEKINLTLEEVAAYSGIGINKRLLKGYKNNDKNTLHLPRQYLELSFLFYFNTKNHLTASEKTCFPSLMDLYCKEKSANWNNPVSSLMG